MAAVPSNLSFFKYEGLGNDFVVVDERDTGADEPRLSLATRRALCDRHRGVGGDGVLTILRARRDDCIARMHVTNADGSVPEMCGNGLRCVARLLVDEGAARRDVPFVVDTDAGARAVVVDDALVTIDMGPALFSAPHLFPPMQRVELVVDGRRLRGTTVSMGNPHLVLEAPADASLAAIVGPHLERDARFPARINVELATLRGPGRIDVVVWERGVGLTEACGTGACAVAAAFAAGQLVPYDDDVTVVLPGGPLLVRVPRDGGSVRMRGPARRVFRGVVAV